MTIDQSFHVFDTLKKTHFYFIRLGEDHWIAAHENGNPPMTQEEVNKAYQYFSSHWQDYNVTNLQNEDI